MKRCLIITEDEGGHYTLFNGTSVADKLQDDEALGVVAAWLLRTGGQMRYGNKIESFWEMKRRITAEIEAKLRPVDRLLLKDRS